MKKSFIAFFSLLSIHADRSKSIPYYISSNISDKTLAKTEALFVLGFSAGNDPVKGEIKFSCNGINKTGLVDTKGNISLKIKPGKYLFKFFYTKDFLEITTDSILIKSAYREEVKVNFQSSIYPVICDKPVIYVYKPVVYTYPQKPTSIHITLDLDGKFWFHISCIR